MLNRAILIVLDSVGVGNAADAAAYGVKARTPWGISPSGRRLICPI